MLTAITRVLPVFLILLLLSISAQGDVISYRELSLPDVAYTHLGAEVRAYAVTTNFGTDTLLRIGRTSSGILRSFLAFPLTDIPTGSTITDVSFYIAPNSNISMPNGTLMYLYPITGAGLMVETEVTWNKRNTSTSWATPGGDYDSGNPLSTAAVSLSSALTFASTTNFVAAAQAALDAGQPLQMILMSPYAEAQVSGTDMRLYFNSDNAASATNRPKLTVTYLVPEPSSAALLVLSMLPLVLRRRR